MGREWVWLGEQGDGRLVVGMFWEPHKARMVVSICRIKTYFRMGETKIDR